MSDRFDALMAEINAELSSLTLAEGDDLIRMSDIERGNRLEALCDRMASRGAESTLRAHTLNFALSHAEQAVISADGGVWVCPICEASSVTRHAIGHTEACPFSQIDDRPVASFVTATRIGPRCALNPTCGGCPRCW